MRLWLSVSACVLVPVGGAPPARSPHASFARSGRSRSPARPCRRPPAPRPGPPVSSTQVEQGVLMIGSACLLEARPGPAAAWLVLLGRAAVCAGGRRPAREIATRELRSEWSISKPGQALPPPTGTAARPSSGSCGTTPIPATMSGLDHSRINKPSTTCAHAQWCNACPWGGVRIRGWACWCGQCTRSVGITPLLFGCTAT